MVRTLVPFEPPLMRYLPDGQKWLDLFAETYDWYRESGVDSALTMFRERTFPAEDQRIMARAPRNDANVTYWFEHELRQYPVAELDFENLRTHADRIVLAMGREGHGYPVHDVVPELGKLLGADVIELPGGHVGCVAHPAEFARELIDALAGPRDPGAMTARDWDDSYAHRPHWDLGRPQPAFQALADAGHFRGRVLDVGCGTGEHVLLCAALGLDATGIDIAAAPLHAAERKAGERGLPARFLRHDVRKLADLGESFDTVLDCGLFHVFGDEDRAAYVGAVRSVVVPGGRFFLLCFSDREPGDQGPRRLTHDDLMATFADGWRIDSIERTTLDSPTRAEGVHAWSVACTRELTMLTTETRVETTKAVRLLVHFCQHASKMDKHLRHMPGGHARPEVLDVEFSDTHGTVNLSWGRCVLDADPEALTVRVEAANEEHLRGIQRIITADLERFGHRDNLTVSWSPHTDQTG